MFWYLLGISYVVVSCLYHTGVYVKDVYYGIPIWRLCPGKQHKLDYFSGVNGA